MSGDAEGATSPQVKCLRESAAAADFGGRPDRGGSHARVAKACASVISTNDDLKVIGLLGPWGSGKSTVVRLIQRELKADETLQTHVFCYDAWLHQSDPPRRAFLETLLQFLIDHDLTTQDRWQTQLDILNRQIEDTTTTATPSLTAAGRLLLLSLVCLPFGMQFIGHDWFEAAFKANSVGFAKYGFWFGLSLLVVPPFLALLTYLWWRPRWNPLSPEFRSWDNWRTH
ncbi:P-loop NTPase fold protein, partial [Brevundimonas sp.]|uniref:P-loop NTPase fold protein n=1 Tax=Brevundimonas sp. TaxID=1871086 RepID=UPI002FC6B8D2